MPRPAIEDPIILDDDSDDETSQHHQQPVSPLIVAASSLDDALFADDGLGKSLEDDDSGENFPFAVNEQTLDVDAGDSSEEPVAAIAHTIFGNEPSASKVSDATYNAAKGGLAIDLPDSTLINPRSIAVNYVPPLPISTEQYALDSLAHLAEQQSTGGGPGLDFVCIDLDDFEIYIHRREAKNRLRSLHFLGAGRRNNNRMYFDGVLRVGAARFYVQGVPFDDAPVDMYRTRTDTIRGHISIRSVLNKRHGRSIYYRLGQPSVVYARFYGPFLWVADLGKHFIDFVDHMTDRGRDVRVSHFRLHFSKWLRKTYGRSPALAAWRDKYGAGRDDFGPAVVAYSDYLYKEATALFGKTFVSSLGLFRETTDFSFYKTHQPCVPLDHPPSMPLRTVVTPYMYHLFKDMAIGPYLESTPGQHAPRSIDEKHILPQKRTPFITGQSSSTVDGRSIRPGDVISTWHDEAGSGSKWSASAEKSDLWYALVHRVIEPQRLNGPRSFDIVWLYRPEHTPCGDMKYPWAKELFMCDHCTCSENNHKNSRNARVHSIKEDEVVALNSVEWFGGPDTTADFFIRQTYLHGERSWVQLRLGHVFCKDSVAEAHQSALAPYLGTALDPVESIGVFEKEPNYVVGDTVLAILSKTNKRSEPYEVQDILRTRQSSSCCQNQPSQLIGYRLRRLRRRNEADPDTPDAPPNELLYTDETVVITKPSFIICRCVVRIFPDHIKEIPTPYNRGGAGNVFFMMYRLETTAKPKIDNGEFRIVPLDTAKDASNLRQGFDPTTPVSRLRALELFCGCGNLGRGIDDAGATETRCANDIWPVAMHTFMANVASPDTVTPFIGSADTLLERAIGRRSAPPTSAIPQPGDIDFISGGSPCQGFSRLTRDKEAHGQYKNRSMVASFASFVDVYRPKFGLLENVLAIINNGKSGHQQRRQDIFGQLVCSLLGLGYQLRIMLGNAWLYGAPQQRQRVFLLFAAPGFQLPDIPSPSHGSEASKGWLKSQHTIGRLANGEYIAAAKSNITAFPIVSVRQATADLTDDPAAQINDGIVDICVRHPDHRIVTAESDAMQHKIAAIPTQPYGMGLAQARRTPHFTLLGHSALFSERELAANDTRAYKRTNPTQLFKTVRTTCTVADSRSAEDLHWRDARPLSILEIRLAQGMPDDDLLLQQKKADQWKLVGNAVARQIALALGLSLREAWLGTLCEDRRPTQPVRAPVPGPESVLEQSTLASEDELGHGGVHFANVVPLALTTTTTTTTSTTLVATLTLTTTTRTERCKQNRIFQTSVCSKQSSSPAEPPSSKKRPAPSQDSGLDDLSDDFGAVKRSRTWSLP
ncbi:DNA methyltransferase dim-2 [Sporothrix brasiliensis 5110]|uniref:DNA (cytosine-5-)-methyltransferase n=1 Tax=Sporothrix brasiliensis 5110 TaxID=1398154 RepID=A0A0C2FCZ3_9PEZI|nr:DNA methyltransferase dim-2 [Sporothrix brasiliensis 5110]KIH89018.1 DNA methyltransferase dim-2 [Sporothrix brasiliensis 5110]